MSVENAGSLVSIGSAGSAVATISPVVLPANCLCLAAVETHNATAGNLAKSPPVQTGAVWQEVDSINLSANRILTLYRTMVAADISATMTFTAANGLSQNVVAAVSWQGGVETGGGAHGAGAVVQVVKAGSGASSVTTLAPPPTFAPFGHPNNAAYACFASSNVAAIAPRIPWTELADVGFSTVAKVETQFLDHSDSAANCTAGSGLLAGIALEIKASPTPAVVVLVDSHVFGNLTPPYVRNYTLYAGRTLLICADLYDGSGGVLGATVDAAAPGVTFEVLDQMDRGSGATSHRTTFWRAHVDEDGVRTITFTPSSPVSPSTAYFDVDVISVGNPDPTTVDGDGIVQWATANTTGIVWGSPISDRNNSCVMMWAQNGGGATSPGDGWQELVDSASGVNNMQVAWRANADPAPNYNPTLSPYVGIAFELQGAPSVVDPGAHRPVVTVLSPLPYNDPGSPIAASTHLVFSVTDVDGEPGVGGGLERAVPIILFPDGTDALVHNGDAFRPQFAGSTRTPIDAGEIDGHPELGPGYLYDVIWYTGAWTKNPTLLPFAYDMTGLEAL